MLDVDAATPSTVLAHAPGYIDRDNEVIVGLQTDKPVQARDLPRRRPAHGRGRAEGRRLRGRSGGARGLHQVPQDAQRRRLRRLHAGDHALPQVRHHHRPARRLWPRPHHRRLPPRRAVRHRPPARRQARGARAGRRHVAERRGDPHARGTRRADARAGRPGRDGPALRLRHRPPRRDGARGGAVDLPRLSRRDQGGERRGHVDRPHLDLPRHLHRARPARGHAGRGRRAGADRPARAEAAHRPLPAHAGLRRAVQRRPVLGDRMRRRHGPRRPHAGHADQLPHAAHADQPRPGAGAQHHGALVEEPAGRLQALLHHGSAATPRRCSTRTTT